MGMYVAVLLSEASSDAADHEPLFQESFVLLAAESLEEARENAVMHGRGQETSYRNEDGERITWRLRTVVDVNEVLDPELADGAEIYARHFRDYDSYAAFEPMLSGEEL
ncbi:MAG: DUF4288 domain-containing protein [Mycobacteriaceae bacterium]|nr:DUF4288 domain-containing protein [Mycobacteriaceae bacterium]NUU24686.1 DUF4288 domain-containing protein [Streptomycetaceae bacterium]